MQTKISQKQQILDALLERGSVTNEELLDMGVPTYAARIRSLRLEGHDIRTIQETRSRWRYELHLGGAS